MNSGSSGVFSTNTIFSPVFSVICILFLCSLPVTTPVFLICRRRSRSPISYVLVGVYSMANGNGCFEYLCDLFVPLQLRAILTIAV